MDSYHIRGGRKIEGECRVNGAKNAVLPILAASIMAESEVTLLGCPEIADVENMLEILRALGCKVLKSGSEIRIDSSVVDCCMIPTKLMKGMRSSVFLMGPLLARCGEVLLSHPGGCEIGARPIDIHVSALKKLGVSIEEADGLLICRGGTLKGADITLEFPSVGATENVMLAAVSAEGETVIHNSAREPEIADLQNFLNRCGANIRGAGSDTVVISGKPASEKRMSGAVHKIIPDRIEAGTLLAAAAASRGQILLKGAYAPHMTAVLETFENMGCHVKVYEDSIFLRSPETLSAVDFTTGPYPEFPTDMQSQVLALLTCARGESQVWETIFENRFKQVPELAKMGADIHVDGKNARVRGVGKLKGCRVNAADLRGGAALVIAGLMAEGETIIENIGHIERGYDKLDKVLNALGAEIRGVKR